MSTPAKSAISGIAPLSGLTAVITGASSGIGEACARAFASAGANLVLWARRADRLEALAAELRESGVAVQTSVVDVRDRARVEEAAARLSVAPDILVNNAGLARGLEKLHEGRISDWEQMIDTNLKGLLYVSRALVPRMLELAGTRRGGGQSGGKSPRNLNAGYPPTVVSIGSTAGNAAYAAGGVYCATKVGARFVDDGLRIDTVDRFFRVATVQPGMVDTEFSKVRFGGDAARAAKVYDQLVPLDAGDVADAVLYIVSRPAHVQISDLTIMPTCQATGTVVHRGVLG